MGRWLRRAVNRWAVLLLPLLSAWSMRAHAQAWVTRQQPVLWVSGSLDAPISDKAALWLDASWRRMNLGREPQQLVLRPGVQYQVAPGVRLASGYAYLASQPAGSLAASAPQREHRAWQQVVLSHKAGPLALSHRYRLEQRWSHSLFSVAGGASRATGAVTYQNRARYLVRTQGNLGGRRVAQLPITGHLWLELLAALGGPSQSASVVQDRAGVGVTVPIHRQVRLEVSYLRLHNVMTSRRANEVNHTMVMAWNWTGTRGK